MLKLCKGLSPGKPISIGGFNVSPSKNPLKLNIPLNGSIIPLKGMQAVSSFNRSTTATVVDHEGVIHTALINEIRFPGARRVKNLLSNTEVLSTQTVTVLPGSSYILSFSGTGSVTLSGAATGTLSGSIGRVQILKAATTSSLTLTVSGAVLQAQLERLTGSQTEASEYVSTGVLSWPYHGAGVDGVKYFLTDRAGNALSVYGALIEPRATNLIVYSRTFDRWSKSSASVTDNCAVAPDGTTTASLISLTAGSGYVAYTNIAAPTSYNKYSIWLRSISGTGTFTLNWFDFSEHHRQDVTLTTTWKRFYLDVTSSAFNIYVGDDRANTSTLKSCYAWEAQVETGIVMTSNITTSGTAVTRTADVLSYDIGDVITQGQGSWYCEFKYSYSTGYPRIFELIDNTISNTIRVRVTDTKYLGVLVTTGGVNQAIINTSTPISDNTLYKVLLTYKNNSIKLYLNGVLVGEDLSCTVPNLLKLFAGCSSVGDMQLNGYLNAFKYFKDVLSEEEAIRRTS